MESEVQRAEMLLAPTMAFKKVQMADKYPKGQSRGRQWKHLRFLLQAADATSLPPDRPNCERLVTSPLLNFSLV
jgi:INO80 complex subunit C